jgi:2-oxo-4-hydroxy-4-carboxy-5-ureidoimidazoline decarboxylase
MRAGAPYDSADDVLAAADAAFDALEPADWRQAFAAHARIGEPREGDPRGAAE